ncbi:crotonase/enoyl-CoA hydratase family protein [Rhodococcus sp. NPDC003322]
MTDAVLLERRDRTLLITINRPDSRNAINAEVSRGLAAAVDELDEDPGLSVAVLTGSGGNFCAGMDLKAFLAGETILVEGRGLGFTHRPPAKPIISAVEGYALAGGTELTLATDLVVAATNARFGLPEVKRGLAAGAGGLLRLPTRMPYAKAMELALTGDTFTAEDGYEYGLINRLTEPGEALGAALELADRITANGPLGVAATKQIIVEAAAWSPDEAFDRQREVLLPVFASEDAKEGASAFAEKRAPVWRGR